ncbi:YkvA family protein [Lysinibacillus sphaericus]|uniref:DUF1232 domain-containing protein n=1 Tax=Lysinibacillus sphaericus OT4b.31 TaxID=1285586 RepID=R7ZDK8_LYSSH|nr:DUF1232 domain-containing protein [Lysinibacillus sphaericus]EON72222.1 hypothetical protein H131_11613 [Lysinibacillus sphaericus OT4b.31]
MDTFQNIPNDKEQRDFYHKLRTKLVTFLESKTGRHNKFAEYLMFVPDVFHLLIKTLMDPAIDTKSRSLIGATIAYFIFPMDFMPEGVLGFGGFMDDLVLATFVVNTIINKLGPEVIEKHWTGDNKLLDVLQKIAGTSDQIISKIPVKSMFTQYIRHETKGNNK